MATVDTFARTRLDPDTYVFPDPPDDPDDKMTNFDHLTITGNAHYLAVHLGRPETTLVAGDRYLSLALTADMTGLRYPDMIVAFGVDPDLYRRRNAYVISDQGQPPDLVMEIASPSTARVDTGPKRRDYARLGITEYWRFDDTGDYHGTRLAGDRLADGDYVPVDIEDLSDEVLQGYSAVLDLHLRWDHGVLVFGDPATGRRITTLEDERRARTAAEVHAEAEHIRAEAEHARYAAAEARAEAAEARVKELEDRIRRT